MPCYYWSYPTLLSRNLKIWENAFVREEGEVGRAVSSRSAVSVGAKVQWWLGWLYWFASEICSSVGCKHDYQPHYHAASCIKSSFRQVQIKKIKHLVKNGSDAAGGCTVFTVISLRLPLFDVLKEALTDTVTWHFAANEFFSCVSFNAEIMRRPMGDTFPPSGKTKGPSA